jgi:quercetin dioxygenase-like cupin family protein
MEGAVPHKFITQADLHPDDMDFGRLSVLRHPSTTGTKHPTILAVSVLPSKGHDFRYHPNREEVIHVLAGTIEVWVEQKTRILGPGIACSCLLGSCTAPSTRARRG